MDRLTIIKNRIERAKTYGTDPMVSLADIEWLLKGVEELSKEVTALSIQIDILTNDPA